MHTLVEIRNLSKVYARGAHLVEVLHHVHHDMLSAQKNVELPQLLTKLPTAQRKRHASLALGLVGLSERAAHKPAELSGGQQQRATEAVL